VGPDDPTTPGDWPGFRNSRGRRRGKVIKAAVLGVHLVELTYHALMRMKTRRVSQGDVVKAVRNPTQTRLPTEPGHERVRWQKDSRTSIDVVYAKKADRVAIVTVWKTKRGPVRPPRKKK
jgi:hypothetical protein